jgi:hypothetical protein
MREFFGTDEVGYSFTAAGITRNYDRLSQAAQEAVNARVYGGIHFRSGCEQGRKMGEKIAHFISVQALRPLHKNKHDAVLKPNLRQTAPVVEPARQATKRAGARVRAPARVTSQ